MRQEIMDCWPIVVVDRQLLSPDEYAVRYRVDAKGQAVESITFKNVRVLFPKDVIQYIDAHRRICVYIEERLELSGGVLHLWSAPEEPADEPTSINIPAADPVAPVREAFETALTVPAPDKMPSSPTPLAKRCILCWAPPGMEHKPECPRIKKKDASG